MLHYDIGPLFIACFSFIYRTGNAEMISLPTAQAPHTVTKAISIPEEAEADTAPQVIVTSESHEELQSHGMVRNKILVHVVLLNVY